MGGIRTMAVALGLAAALSAPAGAAPWDMLISTHRVEADPNKTYTLTESNGPWMIMACSFSGPKAEQQAKELVLELRKRYKLPAYSYEKTFDLGKDVQGTGIDQYGNPRKMKYSRGGAEVEEIAVLVGDYPTVDDAEAQAVLRKVKYLQPECLKLERGKETALNLASLRTIQSYLLPDGSERKRKGPMGHAIVTTNPLLPKEYFVPKGVDDLLVKANEGVEHCLLDCPGKYTVLVAQFSGRSRVLLGEKDMAKELSMLGKIRPEDSQLVKAAEDAHALTTALRIKGYEAYEFHGRNESLVTVGSFDSIGTPGGDGTIRLDPRIEKIINTFRADDKVTPTNPTGQPTPQKLAGIPFAVQPKVIEVPKRPVTAALSRSTASQR
jgi:hypothetical protein